MVNDVTRVDKPWGYELHWAKTDRYVGKLIHVNAGHALSLQYHNIKDETIYLQSGRMLFENKEGAELIKREVPTADRLAANRAETERLQARMVALQEELDWLCYRLYGLLEEPLEHVGQPPSAAPSTTVSTTSRRST